MESNTPSKNTRSASSLSYEKKLEFLLIVLEAEEKRRSSMENKSSILIASNAILIGAIISLGVPALTASAEVVRITIGILFIVVLACLIVSIHFCIQVLAPSGDKRLKEIIGWSQEKPITQNLMYFGEISKLEEGELREKINELTEQKILDQVTSRVRDLSKLLKHRYRILRTAHRSFVIGVAIFSVLAVIKLIIG